MAGEESIQETVATIRVPLSPQDAHGHVLEAPDAVLNPSRGNEQDDAERRKLVRDIGMIVASVDPPIGSINELSFQSEPLEARVEITSPDAPTVDRGALKAALGVAGGTIGVVVRSYFERELQRQRDEEIVLPDVMPILELGPEMPPAKAPVSNPSRKQLETIGAGLGLAAVLGSLAYVIGWALGGW